MGLSEVMLSWCRRSELSIRLGTLSDENQLRMSSEVGLMPDANANERPTMRQQVEALRYVPPLLRMVWETHPGYTLTMAALRLLRSAIPVATLWVGKLILDAIVGMREGTPDLTYCGN